MAILCPYDRCGDASFFVRCVGIPAVASCRRGCSSSDGWHDKLVRVGDDCEVCPVFWKGSSTADGFIGSREVAAEYQR